MILRLRLRWKVKSSQDEGADPRLVSIVEPSSYVIEEYRKLRAKLFGLGERYGRKAFVISSADIQEGKTITAINLAVCMATSRDKKVILVDADLRKPSVHAYLKLEAQPGLREFLDSASSVHLSSVKKMINKFNQLDVLTSGAVPQNPTELLSSEHMANLLGWLKQNYDVVLIDSMPLLPTVDTQVICEMADALLLVVRAGKGSFPLVEKAIRSMDKDKIIGVVMNAVASSGSKYSKYYYNYYQRHLKAVGGHAMADRMRR